MHFHFLFRSDVLASYIPFYLKTTFYAIIHYYHLAVAGRAVDGLPSSTGEAGPELLLLLSDVLFCSLWDGCFGGGGGGEVACDGPAKPNSGRSETDNGVELSRSKAPGVLPGVPVMSDADRTP